jgi:hypothetical protein
MLIIAESHQDLMEHCARPDAYLATVVPDGSPHVGPACIDVQRDYILINATKGRTKGRNMRALRIRDSRELLQYMQIRGRITEVSVNGALEHIKRLSMSYGGWPWCPVTGQVRLTYRFPPEHVSTP